MEKHRAQTGLMLKAPSSEVWKALTNPSIAKLYFHGAEITSDWKVGSEIRFRGVYKGHTYEEKGIILQAIPDKLLEYTHWSSVGGLPDRPENYRIWSFTLLESNGGTHLSISESNIESVKQQERSIEFWNEVLQTLKGMLE